LKILLGSHHFFPSVGGIETSSALLALEFAKLGHDVHVVTQTGDGNSFSFPVIRRPSAFGLFRQVRWCDVFLQNNISLRTMWPLLFVRRPLFIIHQTWITDAQGRVRWLDRLKLFLLRFVKSFAISQAVAERLPTLSINIGNPYDDEIFENLGSGDRTNDLVFVGRLVSDKGLDILIDALAILRDSSVETHLTVVGDGPERPRLEEQIARLNLQASVTFRGQHTGRQLAEILNLHAVLVIPSRWQEPFGIVAVEGIACGCVAVGADGGGLAEAIGPCGKTFRNGDPHDLAIVLTRLLRNDNEREILRRNAASHLARFAKGRVAKLCLEAMNNAR
jgi:glycosyltransferase involved in cell wall biosynthesis